MSVLLTAALRGSASFLLTVSAIAVCLPTHLCQPISADGERKSHLMVRERVICFSLRLLCLAATRSVTLLCHIEHFHIPVDHGMDHPDASTHLLVCARHGASAARIVSACMPPNSSAKGMLYRACCTGHVVPLIMRHAAGQPVAHRGRFGVSTFRRFDGSLDGNLLRDVMMRCSNFAMQTSRWSACSGEPVLCARSLDVQRGCSAWTLRRCCSPNLQAFLHLFLHPGLPAVCATFACAASR